MLGVASGREITTQAHGNGAGGDFRKPGSDDYSGAVDRASQPGGQGKRHGQPIRHANDDVANCLARRKVFFDVSGLWHLLLVSEARALARASLTKVALPHGRASDTKRAKIRTFL